MTIAELLEEKGWKPGLLEGFLEARLEARLEGKKDALLVMLDARFGALPDELITKVRTGSAVQLEDWLKRLLAASTPNKLLT